MELLSKKCSKCKIEKLISGFFRNKSQKDGYSNQCKYCKTVNTVIYHPKTTCECGKTIQKYYLKHHLQRKSHISSIDFFVPRSNIPIL